jgi:RING-type zinc-finger
MLCLGACSPICMEIIMSTFHVYPCGHHFCQSCSGMLFKRQAQKGSRIITCPFRCLQTATANQVGTTEWSHGAVRKVWKGLMHFLDFNEVQRVVRGAFCCRIKSRRICGNCRRAPSCPLNV